MWMFGGTQGAGACDSCAHAQDGDNCVSECPPCKYRDADLRCRWCHANCGRQPGCTGSARCTGPGPHLGLGGCTECAGLLLDHEQGDGSTECLNRTLKNCQSGFYFFGGMITIPSNSTRGRENVRVVSHSGRKPCILSQ